MTVDDVVRTDPIAATRKASVAEVASLMRDEPVGNVVIEEDRLPVGIVTDRAITVQLTAEGRDPSDVTSEDVMTEDPSPSTGTRGSSSSSTRWPTTESGGSRSSATASSTGSSRSTTSTVP